MAATPWVLGITAAAFLAGSSCTVTQDQPSLVGQDIHLTVIHTADIHSRLFPYYFVPNTFDQGFGLLPINAPFGGMARVTTVAKNIRKTSERSIWLDSGDCFEGAPVFNIFKGEAEMRSLSLAGVDAAVVGNHEFDLGAVNLYKQISNWAQFGILAANYIFDDPTNPDQRSLKDVIQPYEVFDVQGVKIGVIGMANYSSLTSISDGGNSLGIRAIDESVALSEYVRLLRPVVDVIVVVSHLGLDEDEGLTPGEAPDQNEDLPLDGVDLILGGHLHIVTNPPKILPNDELGHSTLLVHSGAFAKYVGRIDLNIHMGSNNGDPANRSRITSFAYDNIPIDSLVPDDPDVANLLWPYSVAVSRDVDLNGVFAFIDPPVGAKVLRNDPSGGDSQLGNLVARAMQTQNGVEAEFAMTNSLGIRTDFERGTLTIEDMFNVFPFENTIVVMYLSGSEIQQTLDFVTGVSSKRGCRSQIQVAGLTFDMVCQGTCPDLGAGGDAEGLLPYACAKNIYIGENCRNGNPNGEVDPTMCEPVVPTGIYRVAVNNYIAAGGSGFIVLKSNTSQQDTGVSLRNALQVYMSTILPKCAAGTVDFTDPNMGTVASLWGAIPCIDATTEAHDGRIRTVFE